jgi:hypothetical protein
MIASLLVQEFIITDRGRLYELRVPDPKEKPPNYVRFAGQFCLPRIKHEAQYASSASRARSMSSSACC